MTVGDVAFFVSMVVIVVAILLPFGLLTGRYLRSRQPPR
jgi:hypothetical protein